MDRVHFFLDKKNRRKKVNSENGDRDTFSYPMDIWQILSRYIKPEDVGRFAGICRSANAVVNSPSFWFSLYKR